MAHKNQQQKAYFFGFETLNDDLIENRILSKVGFESHDTHCHSSYPIILVSMRVKAIKLKNLSILNRELTETFTECLQTNWVGFILGRKKVIGSILAAIVFIVELEKGILHSGGKFQKLFKNQKKVNISHSTCYGHLKVYFG